MADTSFDLIVLGGGPGGYVAAIRAAQLGMKTAVVEREHLGGICLNWGCIPTKALLRTSEINHLLHHLPDFGFAAVESRFELDKVVKRSRAVAKQLSSGVAHLLRKNKVTVFDGAGKLAGKGKLAVSKDGKEIATLSAPHIILATGARARQLPGIEADGKLIWSYKEAMVPTSFPKSLLVIGSGAIGLENTGVKVDRTHVVIDEYCRTGEPGVYAIGDLAGPPWLAHKASHEGVICVEKIAGLNDVHPMDVHNIPGCTYCRPQVASVGLTEARAKEAGHEVKVGRFPFIGNGKAIAMGEPEGMVKTVFDAKTGELLGAHMVGAEVTEMIQGYTIARTLETTEAELMHTVFPHPTVSETMHEAVLDAYKRAIHF
jgi:pyruvate/2-oxoglutarate dehydrogenase complex dihydrolipoamide dehydrogenase (E3) component